MEQGFGKRLSGVVEAMQHGAGDSQGIAADVGIEVLGGSFQALANLADGGFVDRLAEFFLLPTTEFDQVIDELGLAPGFAGHFQAAESGGLDVEIANSSGAFTDLGQ